MDHDARRGSGGDVIDEANLHRPAVPDATGVGALVLAGSSGRVDTGRVDMLASHGVRAVGMRWFGGRGLPDVPVEVPLESFFDAVASLRADCDRVVLLGLSYGAEAALLAASHGAAVDAVVAFAPTHVAWEGFRTSDDASARPKWTLADEPVPFVPVDQSWTADTDPPAFVGWYRHNLDVASPEVVEAATIPVERITGDVVLVAGGDDQMWPSAESALLVEKRRAEHGLETVVVFDELAGHPVVLPGEAAPDLDRPYAVGGDDGAPERLGHAAWPVVAKTLGIDT